MTEYEATNVVTTLSQLLHKQYGAPCLLGLMCAEEEDFGARDCELAKVGGGIVCWVRYALVKPPQ